MAFKYRYQKLLDLKISEESSKKLEIAQVSSKLAEEMNKLKEILDKKQNFLQEYRQKVSGTIDLPYTIDCSYFMRMIRDIQRRQQQIIYSLETELEGLRRELLDIIKEKKKHEKLREKDYQHYLYESSRIAEKLVDDLVSYKNAVKM
ncbi:MAG TPA: flagellar export protein FliJ [Clostridiales bacterium]|nr:flagellar export protein FliJ [Clostridiales bacterium]